MLVRRDPEDICTPCASSEIDRLIVRTYVKSAVREFASTERDWFRERIFSALATLGLVAKNKPDADTQALAEDLERQFGLSAAHALDVAKRSLRYRERGRGNDGMLPYVADLFINTLPLASADQTVCSVLGWPCQYDADGRLPEALTTLVDGRMVPAGVSYLLCRYKGKHVLASLLSVKREDRTGWDWHLYVAWAEGPGTSKEFIEYLHGSVTAFLVERMRGQTLGINVAPTDELKSYSLASLVYPECVGVSVRALADAFRRWQCPDSPVRRWGALLHGHYGTGKTTVGGVLKTLSSPQVTTFYVPAVDFLNLPNNTSIQTHLRELFWWVRRFSPALLIIDDCDLIFPKRGSGYYHDQVVSFMLTELDGLESEYSLFALFMTNVPIKTLEAAVFNRPGRVHERIEFDGFRDCLSQLLIQQSRWYGLSWQDDCTLNEVLQSDECREYLKRLHITPDVTKNIIERIALSSDSRLSRGTLTEALRTTSLAFGSDTGED